MSESVDGEIHFTESAIGIFDQVRDILETEDVFRPQSTEEELQKALDFGGWNSNERPISDFQMRNLLQTTRRDNAAIFSVPGAGKTVEALAYSTIVAGPDVLFVVVCCFGVFLGLRLRVTAGQIGALGVFESLINLPFLNTSIISESQICNLKY